MMKIWEKLESKSSYHFPNSWWVRGGILLNTCHFKKLWRGQEDQRKPRTSELFDPETLKQFNMHAAALYSAIVKCLDFMCTVYIFGKLNEWSLQVLIVWGYSPNPGLHPEGRVTNILFIIHIHCPYFGWRLAGPRWIVLVTAASSRRPTLLTDDAWLKQTEDMKISQ